MYSGPTGTNSPHQDEKILHFVSGPPELLRMVKLSVRMKAELDNLTDLQVDDPMNYQYFFKEEYPLSGSKGSANLVWKCQLSFTDETPKAMPVYTKAASQQHKWERLCTVECRGCEFVEYDLRGEWNCKGAESQTEFKGIEFDDGEWQLSRLNYEKK
ncbi:hypothetical protein VP01_1964g2 [Puccinia sorghi]|uniref:Uncharacterized protein n=1 Tax=Puccinia sorghi TaxID=27349 RepID=A0A0L6VBV1_9BASI|nr:hypothetical protein VP01_1964g2 [Puccinia sorghi]